MRRGYGRRSRGRRPVRRVRRGRFTRRTKRVPKVFKRFVKREIGRRIENKEIIGYATNQSVTTAVTGTAPYMLGMIPSMSVGTASSQMIGNEIKCKSAVMRGHVNLLPYNATTNPLPGPVYVKYWLLKSVLITGQYSSPGTTFTFDNFFKLSGGGANFQGSPFDLNTPINNNLWRVLKTKTFRLGSTAPSSTGPVSSGTYFDNSISSKRLVINFGKYLRRTLKFADGGGQCTNNGLYLLMQCVGADGQSAGGYKMVEFHYSTHFKFEDA